MRRKISGFITLVMVLILLTGCGNKKEEPVLPPARTGTEGTASASLEKEYGFETAFEDADLVAHIRIGDWLAEDTDICSTFYNATVLQQYKGDGITDIVIKQSGDSRFTFEGYPLFTYGNELLVFCKKAVGLEYSNAYWIIGSFTTVLDAVTTESGDVYYMDRYGIMGSRSRGLANYAIRSDVGEELQEIIVAKDALLSDMNYPYIYSAEDIKALATDKLQR